MKISFQAISPIKARRKSRRAIITLEAIIWIPILAILLAAVIEMGLLLTGSMHVAAASRLGAKLAAETTPLTPANTAAVAMTIRGPIDDYFQNAGYGTTASAGVRLQHNIGAGGSAADGTCPAQTSPALPLPPSMAFPDRPYSVRVVVCVDATTVTPNLLTTFGFDISSVTLELATTYPYEHLP